MTVVGKAVLPFASCGNFKLSNFSVSQFLHLKNGDDGVDNTHDVGGDGGGGCDTRCGGSNDSRDDYDVKS